MSKIRVRQCADGSWLAYHKYTMFEAASGSRDGAIAEVRAMVSYGRANTLENKLAMRDSAIVELEHDKRRLNTWRSIAIAQFVSYVATGVIIWIGGLI